MSNYDYLPSPDQQFAAWLTNFVTVCSANQATLGLTPAEFTTIATAASEFTEGLTESDASKATTKAKVASKDELRRQATAIVRTYAREFKANPNVPGPVLTNLGIVTSGAAGPVTQVTGLQVTGCADGVNKLIWNRSGNIQGTIFIVETKPQGSSTWAIAAAVTRTNFNHEDQQPGEQIWYRIVASRAGVSAVASLPVAAYGGSDSAPLTIAA